MRTSKLPTGRKSTPLSPIHWPKSPWSGWWLTGTQTCQVTGLKYTFIMLNGCTNWTYHGQFQQACASLSKKGEQTMQPRSCSKGSEVAAGVLSLGAPEWRSGPLGGDNPGQQHPRQKQKTQQQQQSQENICEGTVNHHPQTPQTLNINYYHGKVRMGRNAAFTNCNPVKFFLAIKYSSNHSTGCGTESSCNAFLWFKKQKTHLHLQKRIFIGVEGPLGHTQWRGSWWMG